MIKTFLLGLLSAACVSAQPDPVKIVLVGDSTVTDNAGWGLGFKQFLIDGAECVNTSQGGRSSKSFRDEGRWTQALAMKGDYYLIQFGHNNEPGKPGRSTDMPTFISDMTAYVNEARAAGAKPVLVTPLTRRQWDREHPGKIKSSLAPYADEVRKIAVSNNVPLIDLHSRSIELCESLGAEKCLEFSPLKKSDDGRQQHDGTHLNDKGHLLFGRLAVEELRKCVPELSQVLRDHPVNDQPVAAESSYDAVVSADGSGTYTTVQAAVDAVPDNNNKPFRILIKPGKYAGPLTVPANKRYVRFIGEELENTILTYSKNVKEPEPNADPKYTGIGVVIKGSDFSADRITFENTSGDHGQALALRIEGDRAVLTNCRMLGWQDTLRCDKGRQYFKDCHVEGRVDFIYGDGTAVFDHCSIHSKNGGYVTAASTPADQPFGFVFFDCKLTGDDTPWKSPDDGVVAKASKKPNTYLGRPWLPHASVAFVRCELGNHIRPAGWDNWGKVENEATARYVEVQSTGPGSNTASRVPWAKSQAADLKIPRVLAGNDSWDPTAAPSSPIEGR